MGAVCCACHRLTIRLIDTCSKNRPVCGVCLLKIMFSVHPSFIILNYNPEIMYTTDLLLLLLNETFRANNIVTQTRTGSFYGMVANTFKVALINVI